MFIFPRRQLRYHLFEYQTHANRVITAQKLPTQGPLMSSCKHFMKLFKQLTDEVIILKLMVTSCYDEVSGPCAQLDCVDTPNSPNFGL